MKKIKLFDPSIDKKDEVALKKVLHSHFWSSCLGTGTVAKFEDVFNNYIGSDECVAINSGSAALHLALSLIEIKNKEVILPAFTFVSTAHAVLLNGGKTVFVDLDPNTLCVDPNLLEKSITEKTRAIIPVHYGGMPCNLTKIRKISKKYNLKVIEDAAHATGAIYKQKKIGTHSFSVCHSFNPTKNLVMPSGGAITLNGSKSKKLKKILNAKRWCGITNRSGSKYDVKDIGWNYFMNEFSASLGIQQMKKINILGTIRKKIAKRYNKEINVEYKMPFEQDCSYQLYWIMVRDRDVFMKKMRENNIETGIHYRPLNTMSLYKQKTKLLVTDNAGKKIVSIPMHPNLSDSDVSRVIKYVNMYT